MEIKEYSLKIKQIIDETPKVKTFRVGIPDETEINFYPGQFFMVSIPADEEKVKRAYSISSSPCSKNYLDISLDKVGRFSTKLFKSKLSDTLTFKGPYGKFYFDESMSNSLLLISGGVGITPLMSIIRFANDKKLKNKIKLIYSVKTQDDIIYHEEIKKMKSQNKNFDYIITTTRSEHDENWNGRIGRVDEQLIRENITQVQETIYFICGPLEFVKSIISILENLGAKKEQIKTDIWG